MTDFGCRIPQRDFSMIEGIRAHWRFDYLTGTTVDNILHSYWLSLAGGGSYPLTDNGTTQANVTGQPFDSARVFGSANCSIAHPGTTWLQPSANIGIDGIIKANMDTIGYHYIVSYGTSTSDGYSLYLDVQAGGTYLVLSVRANVGGVRTLTSSDISAYAGEWIYFAAYYEPDYGHIFINNTEVARSTIDYLYGYLYNNSTLYIGSRGSNDYFSGQIAEIRLMGDNNIYAMKGFSQQQERIKILNALSTTQCDKDYSVDSNTVGCWILNNDVGTPNIGMVVVDETGNHNGVVTGQNLSMATRKKMGIRGRAYTMAGTGGQRIDIPSNDVFWDISNGFTWEISGVILPHATTSNIILESNYFSPSSDSSICLYMGVGGFFRGVIYDDNNNYQSVQFQDSNITGASFYKLVFGYDVITNKLFLYLHDYCVLTNVDTGFDYTQFTNPGTPISIGGSSYTTYRSLYGHFYGAKCSNYAKPPIAVYNDYHGTDIVRDA